ncbi:MAG: hypothetical protein ACUVTD_09575, partial [Nitrososphaerales archaeon]
FNSYPYLFINGVKRSGKTKLLLFINQLTFNSVASASISTAGLYYAVQDMRATLTIDENERLYEINERTLDMRAVLLSGFKKGAYAHRVLGEEGKRKSLVQFDLYSPKALANIFGIENILEDRCIVITMLRALGEQKNREIDVTDEEWQKIRDSLYILCLDYISEVCVVSEVSEALLRWGISSREADIWKPIFTLAKFFEEKGVEGLIERIGMLAKKVKEMRHVEDVTESTDLILAQTLRDMVQIDDWYSVQTIKEKLIEACGGEKEAKWINNTWVGRALKRLGLDEKRRLGTGMQYHLSPETVNKVCQRLAIIPPTLETTQTTQTSLNEKVEQTVYRCRFCNGLTKRWRASKHGEPIPLHEECEDKFKGDL